MSCPWLRLWLFLITGFNESAALKNLTFLRLLIAFSTVFLVSCSKYPKELLGKWHNETVKKETLIFYKDGSLEAIEDKETEAGNYTLIDKNTIKVGVGGLTASKIATYSFDKEGFLVLTEPNGNAEKFKKID